MTVDYKPFTDLLSDIIDNRGRTCPTSTAGFPLIATNCIRNDALYPVFENIRYVSKETIETWFRGHPEPGDIIFVNKGTPGRVCMVPDPVNFCIAQDMVAIRADKKKIYPKYLFAVLRSSEVQTQIENMHVGTLIPHFKKGDFDKLLIPVPDRKTQEIIGNNYFTLSNKIELNLQMNETLEAMARVIFQSWFVDFDPVRAKAEGRDTGLPPEIAALFPDGFEEIDGWEVPRGWRVGTIGESTTIVGGGTPSTTNPDYWEGGTHNFVTPKDLASLSTPILLETEKKITDQGVEQISSRILPLGTVLLSSRAPIGYIAITMISLSINQGFIGIICNKILPNYYVLIWVKENLQSIIDRANGTTFLEISKSNFKPMEVLIPKKEVLNKFVQQVKPLYDQIKNNERQSRTLTQVRDALLPKLMSGEINIS